MHPWRAITRLIAIFAILGLVLAPVTTLALADGKAVSMTPSDFVKSPMAGGGGVAVAGMLCCSGVPVTFPDSAKTCALAAMCHAKIVQVAMEVTARYASRVARALVPANDAVLESLTQAPPSRPPRA